VYGNWVNVGQHEHDGHGHRQRQADKPSEQDGMSGDYNEHRNHGPCASSRVVNAHRLRCDRCQHVLQAAHSDRSILDATHGSSFEECQDLSAINMAMPVEVREKAFPVLRLTEKSTTSTRPFGLRTRRISRAHCSRALRAR
jgi:hypothetical protein